MTTQPDAFQHLRSRARRRSHFWPGAGFALLGHPGLAALGTLAVISVPAALLGLALGFRPLWIWLILAALVFYLASYLAEQILCRSMAIYPDGERRFLSRFLVPVCVVGYGAFLAVVVVFLWSVSALRVAGPGMAPTLLSGDLVLYQRQVWQDDLRTGRLVFFRTAPDSAWGKGGDIVVARILAVPGDQVAIEGEQYLVNGRRTVPVSPLGQYRPALDIPKAPQAVAVPAGCYFIVQDNPQNSFDSRVLSWARGGDVLATRAIVLSGHTFGKEVE
jgi:signal peptidase I